MPGQRNDGGTSETFGARKIRATKKLARVERRAEGDVRVTEQLIDSCMRTEEHRARLNLDRGRVAGDQPPNLRRRQQSTFREREAFPQGVGRFLDDQPETEAALRRLAAETNVFWDEDDLADVSQLADATVDRARKLGPGVEPGDYMRWLVSPIEIGLARTPADGSDIAPLVLPTRHDLLQYSGLRNASLLEIERQIGRPGTAAALMAAVFDKAVGAGMLTTPSGLLAGTTHRYSGRGSHELGRVAVAASAEDFTEGHGKARSAIHHVIRTVPYLVTETRDGDPALLRLLTLPLVAPADLANMRSPDPATRARVNEWLRGLALDALVEQGDVSATRQQASAARRAYDACPSARQLKLPILLPVMRIERSRPSETHGSPLGKYEREMPGNSIADLDAVRRILRPATQLYLAQTGVEDAGEGRVLAEPEWAARTEGGLFVPARTVIEQNVDASWQALWGVEGELSLEQLILPIALRRHDHRHDVVLLRARAARDLSTGSRPTIYLICPVDLTNSPEDARKVGELLRPVHGARDLATSLREARSAAVSKPEQLLGAQAKAPAQFLTRELERQLVALGRLLRR